MKKLLTVLIAVALVFSLAGCNGSSKGYELALVTDVGHIDDQSFNQGAYEGLKAYAEDNKISYKYYEPAEKSTSAYLDAITLAVDGGAKVVVCPGYLFENAVWQAQTKFPKVNFVILDGSPHNVTDYTTMATLDGSAPNFTVATNTYSIFYKEQQAGFLAGYAAVKDGYTKLGFMGGMAVPAVIRYGYGFVQGADYAAKELGIKDVQIKYNYTGTFTASPEIQATAASWFTSGTQVIFACGGGIGNSIMAAAEANSGKVIGVDVDQSSQSASVITSAMKGLSASVYSALKDYYNNKFPGGTSVSLGADVDGVGLPMSTSKFTKFTQADYDKIFAALANDTNGISTAIVTDKGAATAAALPVTNVKVTLVN